MRKYIGLVSALLLLLNCSVARSVAEPLKLRHVEDFTTMQFRSGLTTALWDTLAGELRLPPFTPYGGTFWTSETATDFTQLADVTWVATGTSGIFQQVFNGATVDTPGFAFGVASDARHIYVADGTSGLQVVTASGTPTIIGQANTPGEARAVDVAGGFAYVAVDTAGIRIFDVTTPSAPALAGSLDTAGTAVAVAALLNTLVIADGSNGVLFVDITDRTAPTLLATFATSDAAVNIAICGNLVFIAASSAGLLILDASDPANPLFLGSFDSPGDAMDVALRGSRAYLADGVVGIHEIDFSNPTAPALRWTFATTDAAQAILVSRTSAYVATPGSTSDLVRISEEIDPLFNTTYVQPSAQGIQVCGSRAILTAAGNMHFLDIADPTSPNPISSLVLPGAAFGVEARGSTAFVVDLVGLRIVDFSDINNPQILGNAVTPGTALDVTVYGNIAFVADGNAGLQLLDVTDPANPNILSSVATSSSANAVVVEGTHAYLAVGALGVEVVDFSDLNNPIIVGSFNTPGTALGVAIDGDRLLVADGTPEGFSGLYLLSISDPTNPIQLDSAVTPGTARDIYIAGGRAFVTDGDNGLVTFRVSSSSLTLDATTPTPDALLHVDITGAYAFATSSAGLSIISIANHPDEDPTKSLGRSTTLNEITGGKIVVARLSSVQTPIVTWKLAGYSVFSDNTWFQFPVPITALDWRATLELASGLSAGPTVSMVEIEWRLEPPVIQSITDVPNDQGGFVQLNWKGSGYDAAGSVTLITEYALFRRIDAVAKLESQATALNSPATDLDSNLDNTPAATRRHHSAETTRVLSLRQFSLPPGTWDFVTTVTATEADEYDVIVPTLADSTEEAGTQYSVFFVSAIGTNGEPVFFDASADSGVSIDNIAPNMPQNLVVVRNGGDLQLSWDPQTDGDFRFFKIYRANFAGFVPSPSNLVHSTIATAWIDPASGTTPFYKLSAVDFSGNESDFAEADLSTDVLQPPALAFRLFQNLPNPFNPATTLRFHLPPGTHSVQLLIFNVEGRRVRTLLDTVMNGGPHEARWFGANDDGVAVSSGMYFYRLETDVYTETKRMSLVR